MKFNLKESAKKVGKYVVDRRKGFLIGGGIAGFTAGSLLMIPATLKAKKAVDAKTEEKGEPLTRWETFKTSAKYYILPFSVEVASGVAIGVGAKQYRDTVVGLASGLSVAEKRISDLETAIPEALGEDATQKVEHQISKDKIEKADLSDTEKEEYEDKGIYWVEEPLTQAGRYMSLPELKNGLASFNYAVSTEGEKTVADELDYLKIDICSLTIEQRQIAYNATFSVTGMNDRMRADYEPIERDDGRIGLLIKYDRKWKM